MFRCDICNQCPEPLDPKPGYLAPSPGNLGGSKRDEIDSKCHLRKIMNRRSGHKCHKVPLYRTSEIHIKRVVGITKWGEKQWETEVKVVREIARELSVCGTCKQELDSGMALADLYAENVKRGKDNSAPPYRFGSKPNAPRLMEVDNGRGQPVHVPVEVDEVQEVVKPKTKKQRKLAAQGAVNKPVQPGFKIGPPVR